ncbi:MAG TPA: HAD family hydrolase [Candidatus Nanoarchaeia archaeon]|nr:HAD family hydrolase [Candidatus Nanoarchaeia archaeon]
MHTAIFLDRDGVINEEKHLLHKKDDLVLLPGVAEAIKLLNDHNFKVIVITNQPVVARGLATEEDITEIHSHMLELLKVKGAKIDKIYFCPHHPTAGENSLYTQECGCRKPKPGMILQAAREFGSMSLTECYMVGDKISDVKAGHSAGCKTILVSTGYGGGDGWDDAVPDYKTDNLLTAVKEIILKKA